MNKRSRKTKGLFHRLIALLLCCICLITAMPVSAIALETDIALVAEKIDTEKPTEEVIVEPEVTATVAPTPTALSNLEDMSVYGGNSDTADTLENRALQPETGISLAAIGGVDSITLEIGESATVKSNGRRLCR